MRAFTRRYWRGCSAEADESVHEKVLERVLRPVHGQRRMRQKLLESVVRGEPGVVADECGSDGSSATGPENARPAHLDFVRERSPSAGAFHLHGRLQRVDGRA